jgi:DNA polymerase III delta' subunit
VGRFLTRGHPSAVAVVERAIRSERPPHALLLAGPSQVGKTTLARDLAAGLLCLAADPADRPCRSCTACRKVERGNHPDVHRLAPEGPGAQVRLGQVQELAAALSLLPLEGRYRVAIVEHAHRLNPDAQNAFLKTLEEPPPRVSIVLAVDDESLVLPTVRSRAARLRLNPVARMEIVRLLVERGLADASRAASLARLAEGRPGLAVALAPEPEATLGQARLVRTLLDLIGADRRARLAAARDLFADGASFVEAAERGAANAVLLGRVSRDQPDPSPRRSASGDELPPPSGDGPPRASAAVPESVDSSGAGSAEGEGFEPRRSRRAAPPAERRRSALAVIAAWRTLARDLALAAHGGSTEIQEVDLLEEIRERAVGLAPGELAAFLELLDQLGAAVEAYANPELALDVLLLRWPRRERTRSAA